MTVYKALIYGVSILLIGTALYYYNKAGIPDMVVNGNDKTGATIGQVYSGTYVCEEKNGCEKTIKFILEEDTTFDVTSNNEEGQEISLGQGTWGIGKGGVFIAIIRKPEWVNSDNYPSTIIANNINGIKIANFSTSKPLFGGMKNPSFVRVKVEENKGFGTGNMIQE